MKNLLTITLSFMLSASPLFITATHAHTDSEVELMMKDMGGNLKQIRGNDNKGEVLAALNEILSLGEKAANKTPYTIKSGRSERSLEEYQQGMANFNEKISAIIEEVSAAESIDGNAIFSQIKNMKDKSHEYFDID